MPTIQVNGIGIYYETRGEGEPLTLLMGLGTDISEWEGIIGWLARKYKVIAMDNRGAGRSDKPDEPYSIEMMANDTAGLLRALAVERTNLLGISMGGRIALSLTLAHPELVGKLVLASTSASGRSLRGRWWFRVMGLLSSSPLFRSKYPQPRYAFLRQREASVSFDVSNRLREIRAPTLILHGKRDRTMPYPFAEATQAGIASSTLVPFEGSHLFMLFRERQRFLDIVAEFLDR